MKLSEIRAQVYLRLTGGRPTTDSSVQFGEIDSYLAPAVNYVQMKQYFIDRQAEDGYKEVNPLMLQVFHDVPVEIETAGDCEIKYSTLPAKPMTLPRGRGIQYVGPRLGKGFLQLSQADLNLEQYYACFKKKQGSYVIDSRTRIDYVNLPFETDKVTIRMLVSVDELGDDDEVVLPSGSEVEVITMIMEFMTGQRLLPNDPINDGQDHTKQGG